MKECRAQSSPARHHCSEEFPTPKPHIFLLPIPLACFATKLHPPESSILAATRKALPPFSSSHHVTNANNIPFHSIKYLVHERKPSSHPAYAVTHVHIIMSVFLSNRHSTQPTAAAGHARKLPLTKKLQDAFISSEN